MRMVKEKLEELMNVFVLEEETIRMVEKMVMLRLSTKHINLWVRQLEMKRKEICELAELMGFEEIKKEIEKEKTLQKWARRVSNQFPKKTKRVIFEMTDNMVWSGDEIVILEWCERNKVFDEITDEEIEEIWQREDQDLDEPVRLNGKYVWETAKRVCDFINAHEDLITIKTFGEYRVVMKKVMKVIKEAHNVERKRRQTSRKERSEVLVAMTQRAKALIADIKRGGMRKEEIERRLDGIFGRGSRQEINTTITREKIVERIEEMSKREEQFEKWEEMRRDAKEGKEQTEGSTSSGGKISASPSSSKEKGTHLMPKRRWLSGEV